MAPAAEAGERACLWHNVLFLHGECVPMETRNISFKVGVFLSVVTIVPVPPAGRGSLVLQRLWCQPLLMASGPVPRWLQRPRRS